MKSEIAMALQKQCDAPGIANPHGGAVWYHDDKRGLYAAKDQPTRYKVPTWQQIIQRVKKNYKIKW